MAAAFSGYYDRQRFRLQLDFIDRTTDVAILTPTTDAILTAIPTSWKATPKETDMIWSRGFPLGGELLGMDGRVRKTPQSAIASTTAILRIGYSGSPVYDGSGVVIGVVKDGEPVADVTDPWVMGLGRFILLSHLRDPIQKARNAPPPNVVPAPVVPRTGGLIRIGYTINVTKDDHPHRFRSHSRVYDQFLFKAQPGYRIVDYYVLDHSATRVSRRRPILTPDGSSLRYSFKLKSGPKVDRYRGWLKATLVTIQKPIE